ncbi:MAG: carboxylating nicotinate-nucleotide diphosphorylase [Chloroflexi bacterium]|nr:carboxylating nicotinate-nucleotide diphosphorylase [Chloroflexota bacterium]
MPMTAIPGFEIQRAVMAALMEDLALGDPTTTSLIPADREGRVTMVARVPGVVSGIEVAEAAFLAHDSSLSTTPLLSDGAFVEGETAMLSVEGNFRSILMAERTAVNFAQRMSGIATATRQYVDAVSGTKATIVDTRKTAPGLRWFDKYAVACGGGQNHRHALGDGVLIKDNHTEALQQEGLSIAEIVERARANSPHTIKIEVEVQSMDEARDAMNALPDIMLLDNMSPAEMREIVKMVDGRAVLEASGGITLGAVAEVAATGVDLISIGALTHSVQALDISLDYAG